MSEHCMKYLVLGYPLICCAVSHFITKPLEILVGTIHKSSISVLQE